MQASGVHDQRAEEKKVYEVNRAMIINQNTPVILETDAYTAVTYAAGNLRRDLKAVCTGTDEIENRILLLEAVDLPDEAYEVRVEEGDHKRAFYEAGLAREDYLRADQCMRRRTAVLCCF